ncbi:FBD-associated F-box protein-like isoform X1 [Iris pallida]|uniref:FBD-associated F-box protein-like isoform X1 n=1 Tax=Iris pallida TaxID=29817 RepID=A0AAX6HQ47_IRIPA|nr:FBD-associated F-box protein-like isoform X1 [Iris pallida]
MSSQIPPPPSADRVSSLPDDVLHVILSFFPDTDERARTSLLSRRFRHLWAHHPSVRLGRSDKLIYLRCSDPDSTPVIGRYQISVDRCLASLLSPVLQSLDLRLFSSRRSFRWIRRAADLSVRDLRLSAAPELDLKVPISLFYCKSLVSLHLNCCLPPPALPTFQGFLLLTRLKIMGTSITDEALASLLSKCPSLQSLNLDACHHLTSLHLSSPNLTKLKIFYCRGLELVRVDAPNLTGLQFVGNVNNLFLHNARRLLNANVCHFFYDGGTDFATPLDWARPIISLSHISERLRVNAWFFRFVLPEGLPTLFRNLRILHCCVDWVTPPMLNGLASLLGHCSNLEQLKIDLSCGVRKSVIYFRQLLLQLNVTQEEWGVFPDYMDKFERACEDDREREVWVPSEVTRVPIDVSRSLKTITVDAFLGTANEMKMLEYLLGKASVLEKLTIGDCMMREKDEIQQLLAYIPRASSHVQICELNMMS